MDEPSSRLTDWLVAHPWRWAVVSGAALAALGLFNFRAYPIVWLGLGAIFGVWNGWIWRPGGAAHRWHAYVLRRFPKKPESN